MNVPRLGLFGRLVLALTAAALLPLLVVAYMVRLSGTAITDQVLRTHAVAARTTAARVGAFLDGLQGASESVARNPSLYEDPGSPTARELLAGLLQAQPRIVGAAVIDPEGNEVIRVQSRARADVVQAVLAAPDEATVLPRRELSRWWIRLESALPEERGRLRLVADGSVLDNVLGSEELGREASLLLASARTGVIIGSAPDVTLDTFPSALVEAGRSGRFSGSSRYTDPQRGDVLGAYAPVPLTDWYVLSRQPARVAEDVAVAVRRQALLTAAGALLFTAVVSFFAWRTVIRPLREMASAQQRLARGPEGPRTGNEIQQLRQGLAALERQTLDRQAIGRMFLGRYLVMDLVGSGGMGSVFRGWDPRLQRHVALKTVHLNTEGAKEYREHLLREAVTVARFNHPHIVAIYDVEDAGELAFLAMEYVDGTDLGTVLEKDGPMTASQAVPLGRALAEALAAAHARGIVHRDLKPANVLLARDGSIKLTDFGVAERVAAVRGGDVYGTPGYVPPEAVAGKPQTASGDLFALGVVLWEALEGRPLFRAGTLQDTLMATTSRPAPPVSSPGTPVELVELVASLLDREPARRPGSAPELAKILDTLADREGWQWQLVLQPHTQTAPPGLGQVDTA